MEIKNGVKMTHGEIVICKHCTKPEYWSDMRWLNGKCMCRNCYKSEWEDTHHELYKWDDLNGERPTLQEYLDQADSNKLQEDNQMTELEETLEMCGKILIALYLLSLQNISS